MEEWYDKKAGVKKIGVGDKMLALFPLHDHPLKARFHGPWNIEKKKK